MKVKVKAAQSCPTHCDPMDYTVHGTLQARILEWVVIPFSRVTSQPGIEPRSAALQADSLPAEPPGKPKNTGVGKPISSKEDLPNPGIKQGSPVLQADSLPAGLQRKWQTTPVFLPGKSHGQRSLVGYSSWDCKSWTQLTD